jgi:hypothetical protein
MTTTSASGAPTLGCHWSFDISALGHHGDQASCVAAHCKKQEPFRRADRTRAGVVAKSGDGHLEGGTLVPFVGRVKSKIRADPLSPRELAKSLVERLIALASACNAFAMLGFANCASAHQSFVEGNSVRRPNQRSELERSCVS